MTTHSDPSLTQAGSSAASTRSLCLCISIAADKALVAEVRRSVWAALLSWGADEIADDMEVVASEMVSNALKYTGGEAAVRLRLAKGQAQLEVEDGSAQQPALRRVGTEAEKGRGLLLVEALAAEWGWRLRKRGAKTVWASLPLPAGRTA
ncbi:ATP-binding protein [Streptomyces sp. NBC_01622]|uniref:ATP-binding protein n=1 Tax=Streptomyces sp. NBC_01622 TaxID=2975903 RepID=UPI00386BB0B9|nr:ATP-binding protein [Streptomyces sp. NBC_01622]